MGFIPEITTRVTVTVDTSGIDSALDRINSNEVLSDIPSLSEDLETKKNTLMNLRDPLAKSVAEGLKSNQEMIISAKHYVTGLMANSVDIMQDGTDYLVGNTAMSVDGFPYPLAIETGRREVYPINAKVLRWFEGGDFSKPVFAKKSKAVKADPFVEPSINQTMWDIEDIIDELIGDL